MNPTEARALLEEEIDVVEDVISWVCRRNGLAGDDGDSFRSYVRFRLVDDEYSVLRKFSGRSSLRTYIKVVVANAYIDYRIKQSGKWRPSAAARRFGRVGRLLDAYLNRDGHSRGEAVQRLASRDDVDESEPELLRMANEIPQRVGRNFTRLDESARLPAPTVADDRVRNLERDETLKRAADALEQALSTLSDQDRAMVLLHIVDGMTVASIARTMKLEQKPLYRRLSSIRDRLRELLEESGVDRSTLAELLDS